MPADLGLFFGQNIMEEAPKLDFSRVAEVNASPSLSADTPADLKLKSRMLDDTIRLVDSPGQPSSHGG